MTENVKENKEEINFSMGAEKLSNIFGYLKCINNEIPMIFYDDRIVIQQKGMCNIEYTEIHIGKEDLVKYNPGLTHENKSINILIDAPSIAVLDELDDICDVSARDDRDYVNDGTSNVDVKVKLLEKKIEFHLPGNVVVWARLIDTDQYVKSKLEELSKMPERIRRTRNDPNIKKSIATVDYKTFDRFCRTESDNNLFVAKIDKKDGLTFVSKTKDGFYELTLKPKCLSIECSSDDNKEYVYICKNYITPFAILNSGPVTVEIRKNKPIILEGKLGEHTTALLTVAPKICEEEKEIKKDLATRVIERIDSNEDLMTF